MDRTSGTKVTYEAKGASEVAISAGIPRIGPGGQEMYYTRVIRRWHNRWRKGGTTDMTTVTEHYGISGEVPFLDVHVDRDNLVFLDPSAIRNDHSPRGRAAYGQLRTLFTEVVTAARSNDAADHARGRELLRHMHEPNETRMGMSQGGAHGKGFGNELSDNFWDELRANPACQNAVLERLEDTRVFLGHVGDDRISDMTTRIIFNVLAEFTQEMMDMYPALRALSLIHIFPPAQIEVVRARATGRCSARRPSDPAIVRRCRRHAPRPLRDRLSRRPDGCLLYTSRCV